MNFIKDLPLAKRRKVKRKLLQVTALRIKQIKALRGLFITPLEDSIETIHSVLKSEYPIEPYLKDSEKLAKHLKKALKGGV